MLYSTCVAMNGERPWKSAIVLARAIHQAGKFDAPT